MLLACCVGWFDWVLVEFYVGNDNQSYNSCSKIQIHPIILRVEKNDNPKIRVFIPSLEFQMKWGRGL